MFGLLKSPYVVAGAFVALGLALGAAYLKGRSDANTRWEARLAQDRITILQDGKDITDEVLNADDAGLCALLGGCGLPE